MQEAEEMTGPNRPRRRPLVGLSLGLVLLFFAPAAASAAPSTAAVADDGNLDVLANGGDTTPHTINVSYSGGYAISDSAGVTGGSGCMQTSSTAVFCTGGGGGIAVAGGAGADRITLASVSPAAGTDPNFTTATGILSGGGNDTIVGSPLADLIIAGDGNDTIDGGLGADQIDGKQGIDTLSYASRPASEPVLVRFESHPDDPSAQFLPSGSNGGAEGDHPDVENVIGTPGNDTMIGYREEPVTVYPSGSANTFTGGAGNDLLLGVSGPDRLIGGPGKDRLIGGPGSDRCVGGSGKDHAKQCERRKSI
jgi:Ca2+-binding RTX toxin-like protein